MGEHHLFEVGGEHGVIDALRPLGISHLDMPPTPSKPWAAMAAARRNGNG